MERCRLFASPCCGPGAGSIEVARISPTQGGRDIIITDSSWHVRATMCSQCSGLERVCVLKTGRLGLCLESLGILSLSLSHSHSPFSCHGFPCFPCVILSQALQVLEWQFPASSNLASSVWPTHGKTPTSRCCRDAAWSSGMASASVDL